jgi:hypothetical protein
MFNHLKQVKQSYLEHFQDGTIYCYLSLKASFYFFIHSIWPDIYEYNGSETISELNNILNEKKRKLNKD